MSARRSMAKLSAHSISGAALAVLLSLSGCRSVGGYFAARGLDLWDVAPVSVKFSAGLSTSVRLGPYFQIGLGGYRAVAFGMGPGRWGPSWTEEAINWMIISLDQWDLDWDDWAAQIHPGVHWPGGPDGRFSDSPDHRKRSSGNCLFVIPMVAGICPRIPDLPPWHAWADLEADVVVPGLGLRAGICPGELLDFLAGIFGFDLFGDDTS